ncbi:MAG: hypothetical protein H7Z10_01690 [Gemmatimonadaceae bacterium]|nr:hypothetical protein [Acetobacteraceae bacterium]
MQGAIVSLDPATGRVLAMSGGWSFETSQFNRATQAQRQPGSSFKPFVYLTALESGLAPSQRILDAPYVQNLGSAGQWRPNNYALTFNGPTSMRIALEKSLNLVTVRLAERVGMEAVAQKAAAFHVVDSMPRVLPASLGAVETTVLRQVPLVQGALVSMDPATGRVLAMSGGWSFETSQFNRATQAQRQPGSSFKPFVYLTALESGLAPSQRILDAPFVQNLGAQGQWRPNNYGMTFNGPTSMRIALEKSLNLVTVRLAERVGMDAVAQKAMAFNVVDGMPRVLPAALGAVETTVLRQAAAYSGLAMNGREVLPSMVDSVQDRDGKVIWRAGGLECRGCNEPLRPPSVVDQRRQVADPASTFQLVTMMQGAVARGTGFAAGNGLKRAIAGKTGTSQESNDAWFVGFTPDLVTAVWVGFDNNTSLGEKETGGSISAPIWHDYMAAAIKTRPALAFRVPDGMTMTAWDSGNGRVTDAWKIGQDPGTTQGTIGAWEGSGMAVSGGPGLGIDSGMGGLY